MDANNEISMLRLRLGNRDAEIDRLKAELRWAQVSPLIEKAALAQGATLAAVPDILERARAEGTWEIRKERAVLVKEGFVAIGPDGDDMTAKSFIKTLQQPASHLFGQTQSPAGGDVGPNPFLRNTPGFNLTRGAEIMRENPALGKKLAEAAGFVVQS